MQRKAKMCKATEHSGGDVVKSGEVIKNKEFSDRLNRACSQSSDLPEQYRQGRGRKKWVWEQLRLKQNVMVSQETVVKWFSGANKPKEDKMRALARLLEVDVSWLSLGTTSSFASTTIKTDLLAQMIASPKQLAPQILAIVKQQDRLPEALDKATPEQRDEIIAALVIDYLATQLSEDKQ
ncbi:helix-turn-helix domain-containing protein [Pseudovibrio ascidiaceicola]|uniref:helix-turn-helix domain-containing protein n=1 Tax=Pseudovibrio ascidiaceicola TaxID=285279 RepID=UPI003D366398